MTYAGPGSAERLIELPNGIAIQPRAIMAMEPRGPYIDRNGNPQGAQLIIETGRRVYFVPCPNLAEAEWLRDRICSRFHGVEQIRLPTEAAA